MDVKHNGDTEQERGATSSSSALVNREWVM